MCLWQSSDLTSFVHIFRDQISVIQWHSSKLSFQSHSCLLQARRCLFSVWQSVFTSVWRKLRAKVGHAWDKCCYICQRNQTTKLAGTMAHHVRSWEFSVWPDNCLPATVFLWTMSIYSGGAHLIHSLSFSHSRLEWKKKYSVSPFPPLSLIEDTHFLSVVLQLQMKKTNICAIVVL